jgi:hypothetical protein
MKPISFLLLLLALGFPFQAQSQSAPKATRTKIEGTELDRRMLFARLKTHGLDHHMNFELVESDFDYRIVFATGQGTTETTWGELNSSFASADVFDPAGTELFRFERKGRGRDEAASDAVAKEIIKRILKLNSLR